MLVLPDSHLCEILRGALLWTIWNERNRIIFRGGDCKSIRQLGYSRNSLAKHWFQIKGNEYQAQLHYILPPDVQSLPVQVLEEVLSVVPVEEEEDGFGEGHELLDILQV